MFSVHEVGQPQPLQINFISKENLLLVKMQGTTVVVPKQSLEDVNLLANADIPDWSEGESNKEQHVFHATEVSLAPEHCSETFVDENHPKYWIFLEGKALLTVAETGYVINEQKPVLIPAAATHQIMNIGDTELKFIEFRASQLLSGHEVFQFSKSLVATGIIN
jgi:mannose-6-phosphate isomerase-like protein (cupin superfamily)